jgi:hypothetical protein
MGAKFHGNNRIPTYHTCMTNAIFHLHMSTFKRYELFMGQRIRHIKILTIVIWVVMNRFSAKHQGRILELIVSKLPIQ